MNDDIRDTPIPDFTRSPVESNSPVPAAAVSAEPSATPEQVTVEPESRVDDRSLNPPSVSDSFLRSFASIYDSVVPPTESRDYIIFSEYGNYTDVSLYLFNADSVLNANGTVQGSYSRYRIYSDYNGDNRFQVYYNQTARLVFPSLGETRSANVYSNVLEYRPNPYISELHHAKVSAVSSTMTFYVLSFACLFALISGVLKKCLKNSKSFY